jgi:hypothetical protein
LTLKDNYFWKEAGEIRDNLISQLNDFESSDNILINLPDNYEGIYIFRNGYKRCLKMNNIKNKNEFLLTQEILRGQKYSVEKLKNNELVFISTPGIIYSTQQIEGIEVRNANNHAALIKSPINFQGKILLFNGETLKEY